MPPTAVSVVMLALAAVLTTVLNKYYTKVIGHPIPLWEFLAYTTAVSTFTVSGLLVALGWPKGMRIPSGVSKAKIAIIMGFSSLSLAIIIPASTVLYALPDLPTAVAIIPIQATSVLASLVIDLIMKKPISLNQKLAATLALAALSTTLLAPPDGGFNFLKSPVALGAVISAGVFAYPCRILCIRLIKKLLGEDVAVNKAFIAIEQALGLLIILVATKASYWFPTVFNTFMDVGQVHHALSAFNWKVALLAGLPYACYAVFTMILLVSPKSATFGSTAAKLTTYVGFAFGTWILHHYFGLRALYPTEILSIVLVAAAAVLLIIDGKKIPWPWKRLRAPTVSRTLIKEGTFKTVRYSIKKDPDGCVVVEMTEEQGQFNDTRTATWPSLPDNFF